MTDRQEELVLLRRRQVVAERYLRGQTQWQIAESLEVDQGTISRDLSWLHEDWLEQSREDTDKRLARELKRLDVLEREAWEGWQRSLLTSERTRSKSRSGDRGYDETATDTMERRDGNPKFLEIVGRCIDRRLEILGVKKSLVKKSLVVNNNTVNMQADLSVTDKDRVKRLCEMMGWPAPDADGRVYLPAPPTLPAPGGEDASPEAQ